MRRGDVIAERYRLEAAAGQGGMGVVYRAVDTTTDQTVAVKILSSTGETDVARFARECVLLSRVVHPALVRYVDHGLDGEFHYLAMEWLEGQSLRRRIAEAPLTVAEAVGIIRRLAEGLEVAHAQGVVHRDLKPSNIILVDGDVRQARLIDFGIAVDLSDLARVTAAGQMVGTWAYMSPEQVRGKGLDVRSDIYALGVLLWECLTGTRMVQAPGITGVLAKILLEAPALVSSYRPDVPPALDELVARLVAKSPDDRLPDCRALVEALDAAADLRDTAEIPAAPTPVLTGSEKRVMSVVLAQGAMPDDATRPIEGRGSAEHVDRIRRLGERFGAVEFLPNGAAMVVVADAQSAAHQVLSATECALALSRAVHPNPVSLATGLGTVTNRLPVGELVDRAVALVEAPIVHRGIRVDAVTVGLLDGRYEVAEAGEGYVLQGERQLSGTTRTVLGHAAPFVGRRRELATLDAALAECVDERVARAVVITGPIGVGKTRLAYEFLKTIEGRADIDVWRARGDTTRAGSPLGMVADTIRSAAGVREGDPDSASGAQVWRLVQASLPRAEQPRVAAFLGALLGVPIEGGAQLRTAEREPVLMGDQIRRAWVDLLDGACQRRPVVLVLEDLHWGGRVVPRLVDEALRRLKERPLFVLALADSALNDSFPRLWNAHALTQIRMQGLSRAAATQLVNAVLGPDTPTERVRGLVDRAQGNAFFLEELIRVAHAGDWAKLPETVLAVAQAPLSQLAPPGRKVLRAAAIFGPTFWHGAVQTLLGGDQQLVDEWLPLLVEQELIRVRATSRFAQEEEYTFRHALMQEAAYGLLTDDDRRIGHGLAAEWLVLAGEVDAAVLARHYERAGDTERAVPCLVEAAEDAVAGGDFLGTVDLVERGLACDPPPETVGALLSIQGGAYKWMGRERACVELCERALALLPRGSDRWYAALQMVAANVANLGNHSRVAAVAAQLKDSQLGEWSHARIHATLAVSAGLFYAGNSEAADELLEFSEYAVPDPNEVPPDLAARLHFTRGLRALMQRDVATGLKEHKAATDLFDAAGEVRRAHNVRVNLGAMRNALGLYAEARDALLQVIDIAEVLGTESAAGFARHNLALALVRLGDLEGARSAVAAAIRGGEAHGNDRLLGGSNTYLAMILLAQGDPAGAVAAARRAVAILADVPTARPYALATLARALRETDPEEALALAKQAYEIVAEVDVEEGDAVVRLTYAELLHAHGEVRHARDVIAFAARRLRDAAARIQDEAWRASFLENVPENREVLRLSEAWRG